MTKGSRVRVPVRPLTFQRYERRATEVTIGGEALRLTVRERPDGTLGQVAIGWRGSGAAGLLGSYAAALSLGLEYGVPLTDLLRPGLGLRFAPDGDTDDPEIPRTYSAVDYCCRRLAIDWLPYPERAALGVFTLTERGRQPDRQDSTCAPYPLTGSHARHRRPSERAGTTEAPSRSREPIPETIPAP